MKIRDLTHIGVVASLYCIMTLILAPLAYGPIQFRMADILQPFVLMGKNMNIAIALGTFLANLNSPFGIIDWGGMPFVSLIAGFTAYTVSKTLTNKFSQYIGMTAFAFIIALGVGLILYVGASFPYHLGVAYVFVSGLIANLLGIPIVNKIVSILKQKGFDI